MKASDLAKDLAAMIARHGDREIRVYHQEDHIMLLKDLDRASGEAVHLSDEKDGKCFVMFVR